MAQFGYAGKILKIDLSDGKTTQLSTSDYADRFLGGRGIAAKIYWDMVSSQTKAFDPENCLVYMTGPLAGFTRLAGCRLQVCGKSKAMEPESFSYANLGGSWGTWLKYAGFDGIAVQGKSDKPVYLFIHDGNIQIRDASSLWGKTTFEAYDILKADLGKEVKVLVIGPAGENLVSFATMLADEGTSGSSGFGSVMGSKMLKAIAVAGNSKPMAADPDRLRNLADRIHKLTEGKWEDILPRIDYPTKLQACYGCVSGCSRQSYKDRSGKRFKFLCQATEFYQRRSEKYYDSWTEVILLAIRLCDGYGLDTIVMEPMIEWLGKCYKEGLLRDEETDIPLSKIGSSEFIETLTRKISFREGFGDILSQGTIKTAESLGKRCQELISYSIGTRANECKEYDPRLILANALLYATEPRRPIQQLHEVSTVLRGWLGWLSGQKFAYLSTDIVRNIAAKFWVVCLLPISPPTKGKHWQPRKSKTGRMPRKALFSATLRGRYCMSSILRTISVTPALKARSSQRLPAGSWMRKG